MILLFIPLVIGDLVETEIEQRNAIIYEKLRNLAETKTFSRIKMSFNETCSREVKPCSALSCSIGGTHLDGENGYIDLLKVPESYSPHGYTGRDVWIDLYSVAKDNEIVLKLVSGLHFSVSTHISAFHTKVIGQFISNPKYFKERYSEEREENFKKLFGILWDGVAALKDNTGDLPHEAVDFSAYISSISPSAIKRLPPETTKMLTAAIKHLACLSCQKCRLWGTIQLKGLRAAVRAINKQSLEKAEAVYLINAFRRVSVSEIQRKKLKIMHSISWRLIFIYQSQILLTSFFFFSFVFYFFRQKKIKKNVWDQA